MRRPSVTFLAIGFIVLIFAAVFVVGIGLYLNQDTIPLFSANTWRLKNAQDGTVLWQADTSCLSRSPVPNGTVTVVENQVVFHQHCAPGISVLKALRMTGEETLWWTKSPSSSQVVAVGDGVINVEDSTRLIRYSLQGQEIWRSQEFTSIQRVMAQADQIVVFLPTETAVLSARTGQRLSTDDAALLAVLPNVQVRTQDTGLLLTQEGKPSVSIDIPALSAPDRSTLWIDADASLLFIALDDTLAAYSLSEGRRVWAVPMQAASAPLRVGDAVYVFTAAQTLEIYEAATGEQTASIDFERAGGYSGPVSLAYGSQTLVMAFAATNEVIAVSVR